MKKMTKVLLLIFLLVGSLMPKGASKAFATEDAVYDKVMSKKKLVIGTSAPFPPYEFYDKQNNLQGLDIELGKKIAKELGVEVEFSNKDFKLLIGELQSGNIDMILSDITPTEERAKEIDFSDVYYTSQVGILVKKDKVGNYSTNKEFKGKVLGAQAGTVQETLAQEDLGAKEVLSLQDVPTLAENLHSGKIDGLVVEDTTGKELINVYSDLTFAPEMIPAGDAAVGLKKDTPKLKAAANKVIGELKSTGEIQKMYETASKASQKTVDENKNSSASDRFNEYGMLFLQGTGITVGIALASILIGVVLGLIFFFGSQVPYIGYFFKAIVSFLRGTPLLVQLYIFYLVVFGRLIPLNELIGNQGMLLASALFALGLNSGAYISEIMRAGVNGVDKGQMEAARSLGLSHYDTMKSIILPQAIKNILPALGNEFVVIVKESAIVSIIGVVDVTRASEIMRGKTYDPFTPLIIAAIIYYVLTLVMSQLVAILERRLAVSDRG